MSQEPRFGFKNLIKSNKGGKVKAFFNLLIPTESIGSIELSGFKVVEGEKGMFISLPNRAVKKTNAAGVEETKYYNNIRFQNQEKYNEVRKSLNEELLPLIVQKLS